MCLVCFSQEQPSTEIATTKSKSSLVFQGDSRRTIINKESVAIYGIRIGVLFHEKYEVGIGGYSSNLFGILGSTVDKNYQDNTTTPPSILASRIGFHYFSIYGEYTLLNKDRIILTTNNQIGLGWVDIDFTDPFVLRERKTQAKSLIEHSIKANVKVLEWLRLTGGLGYRYLIGGEDQIRKTFNAPIYNIGFSVDLKVLRTKMYNRKNTS